MWNHVFVKRIRESLDIEQLRAELRVIMRIIEKESYRDNDDREDLVAKARIINLRITVLLNSEDNIAE